jgi:putative transposase
MREIAEIRRRYGCPRIYLWVRREGWQVNHKKVERLCREEGLSVPAPGAEEGHGVPRVALRLSREPGTVKRWILSLTGWPLIGGSCA